MEKCLTPKWDETFEFAVKDFTRVLEVEVRDKDMVVDEPMGSFTIKLEDLLHKRRVRARGEERRGEGRGEERRRQRGRGGERSALRLPRSMPLRRQTTGRSTPDSHVFMTCIRGLFFLDKLPYRGCPYLCEPHSTSILFFGVETAERR